MHKPRSLCTLPNQPVLGPALDRQPSHPRHSSALIIIPLARINAAPMNRNWKETPQKKRSGSPRSHAPPQPAPLSSDFRKAKISADPSAATSSFVRALYLRFILAHKKNVCSDGVEC